MSDRTPRVPTSVLDALYQAALDDRAADKVMLVRPVTVLHMIDEIRHKRAVEAREEHLCDVAFSAEVGGPR